MPRRADYTLILTNPSGTSMLCDPIGTSDPLAGELGWTRIEAKPRHNVVGSGTFTIAARPDLMPALHTPDARVLVRRALEDGSGDTDVVMAGPIEIPDTGFEVKRDGTDGPGLVGVNFADDRKLIANRLLYPDPAHESNAQAVARYVLTSVNPELAIWNMANLNLGPGAIASRRHPNLTMRALQGLAAGVTVTKTFTRDWDLIEAMREIDRLAKEAGAPLGIGFRVVQNGAAGLQFQTFAPQDLSSKVVFARMLGNVTAGSYSVTAPTVTHAITGNADAGTARIISERVNAAAVTAGWNRVEAFVDARSAANLTEQNKIGDQALADGGPKSRAQVVAVETADCRYDYDFGPGDLVSYLPYPGGPYVTATCQGADITVTENGEDIVPIIGTDDQGINADAKAAEFRKLWAEIRRMQGAL
jgi:hypothetical protein